MRLTAHTDYALRIMLHAAKAQQMDKALLSIPQVADAHAISRNNVMKVVNHLATQGLVETVRGRSGGFRLAQPANTIYLGDIVRKTEPCLNLADCSNCVLSGQCGLTGILRQALHAFLAELDKHSLAAAAEATTIPSNLPFGLDAA